MWAVKVTRRDVASEIYVFHPVVGCRAVLVEKLALFGKRRKGTGSYRLIEKSSRRIKESCCLYNRGLIISFLRCFRLLIEGTRPWIIFSRRSRRKEVSRGNASSSYFSDPL